MERFTVSLDSDLFRQFDRFIRARGYANRSEAVRDLLRATLERERLDRDGDGDCVGCLSYIYNHQERELTRRLTQAQHEHHDLILSTMHVHLDHDSCMEVAILQGPTAAVTELANRITAETGVRHGKLNAIPVAHNEGGHHHHATPQT